MNNNHNDELPGQGVPGHDGFEGNDRDSWAPSSPDMNPCDFFLQGYLKEVVNKELPANLSERITREFSSLPEANMAKVVFGMKEKSLKLLKTGGEAFEGKKIRL